ncbi:hypothetical protein KI387_031911, partial [Taxus chinensis]
MGGVRCDLGGEVGARSEARSEESSEVLSKSQKGCDTGTSQEVTHPSTTLAQARLTTEFRWDPVHKRWYDRTRYELFVTLSLWEMGVSHRDHPRSHDRRLGFKMGFAQVFSLWSCRAPRK